MPMYGWSDLHQDSSTKTTPTCSHHDLVSHVQKKRQHLELDGGTHDVFIAVHVDDLIVVGSSSQLNGVVSEMRQCFTMKVTLPLTCQCHTNVCRCEVLASQRCHLEVANLTMCGGHAGRTPHECGEALWSCSGTQTMLTRMQTILREEVLFGDTPAWSIAENIDVVFVFFLLRCRRRNADSSLFFLVFSSSETRQLLDAGAHFQVFKSNNEEDARTFRDALLNHVWPRAPDGCRYFHNFRNKFCCGFHYLDRISVYFGLLTY